IMVQRQRRASRYMFPAQKKIQHIRARAIRAAEVRHVLSSRCSALRHRATQYACACLWARTRRHRRY
ncbi:hypothetical protein LPJ73_007388, partial [Coemansia sp. RSA 2703]